MCICVNACFFLGGGGAGVQVLLMLCYLQCFLCLVAMHYMGRPVTRVDFVVVIS